MGTPYRSKGHHHDDDGRREQLQQHRGADTLPAPHAAALLFCACSRKDTGKTARTLALKAQQNGEQALFDCTLEEVGGQGWPIFRWHSSWRIEDHRLTLSRQTNIPALTHVACAVCCVLCLPADLPLPAEGYEEVSQQGDRGAVRCR